MRHRLWPLALVLVAACASAPPIREEARIDDAPEAWQAGTTAAEDSVVGWWSLFASSDLDGLIEEALANNPSLHAAVARIDAASAGIATANSEAWPQVSMGGSGSRSKRNFVGFPSFGPPGSGDSGPVSVESNSFGVSLDVSWEVDLWGRIRNGRSAALADKQAAQAQLAGARSSVAAQVCKAFFAVAEAESQVQLAQTTVQNRQQALDKIEARYERGLRSSLDVHLARTELAGAQAQLALRRTQLGLASRQLELLLGRYPAGALANAQLPPLPGPLPAGLPADLIARRPDLVAAERALAAADRRLTVAKGNLYPRISLTGSAGTATEELRDLTDSGNYGVWTIGASIGQPLFQGGRILAGIDAAGAGVREAAARFEEAALMAYADVEGALEGEARLAEQEQALTAASEASRAARELAESRYERGLSAALVLLDAQRSNYDAQSRLLQVRRQRLDNRVNLHLSLGGGFSREMLDSSPESTS